MGIVDIKRGNFKKIYPSIFIDKLNFYVTRVNYHFVLSVTETRYQSNKLTKGMFRLKGM